MRKGKVPPEEQAVHERIHEVVSREYKAFTEEEALARVPLTLYEKACHTASRIMKVNLDPKTGRKLQASIDFAHLRISPGQVASLTMLITLAVCLPTFIVLILGNLNPILCPDDVFAANLCARSLPSIPLSLALFTFIATISIAYYIYLYPHHLRKRYEMSVGSDMVSAILYIVVYMRNVPSLEGAADFAARNMTGPMSAELRKLLWDVRVGNYLSMEDALLDYAKRWKNNREFSESVELLIASMKQTEPRSTTLLDEAVRVILDGNRESAAAYVNQLKMPITVIHAMGLILPVMGLVLFPIIAIFLSVDATPLFLLYDIMLPLVLFFMISRTLERRPATYSKIDISKHPSLPPPGRFFWGKKAVRVLPVAAIIMVIIVGLGVASYFHGITCTDQTVRNVTITQCVEDESRGLFMTQGKPAISWPVLGALLATIGLALGPAIYYLLLSRGRSKLRDAVRTMETEFKEALFQLGTALGGGAPVETAMLEATKRMEGLKIRDLFQRAAFNMQRFAMSLENAFFDGKQGALIFYPSLLIRSIIRAVIESSRKGVRNASNAMLAISQYLKGLHTTQLQVQESLSDVTSSLKLQAYALTPLISGVVATMAVIIIRILNELGAKTAALGPGSGLGGLSFLTPGNLAITPFQFIIVVSIFLLESMILLSYLMSGIEAGEDPIGRGELTGWVLIVGTVSYIITTLITTVMFGPLTIATAAA